MNPKLSLIPWFLFLFFTTISAEEEYPVAVPTDQPGIVISPFDPDRLLDVADLKPNGLAEDPVAKKIFRIPSLPAAPQRPVNSTPLPEPEDPLEPAAGFDSGGLPADLTAFIQNFNLLSAQNDPAALLPYYANPVENYFGTQGMTHERILQDRSAYIRRFPQREYAFEGAPVLLGKKGDLYDVLARVRYQVRGDSGIRSGAVSHHYKIRRANSFTIVSIVESRATAAEKKEEGPYPVPTSFATPNGLDPNTEKTVYQEFQFKQIRLFLETFAASGQINEPGAMLDFLAPEISQFYEMKNPSPTDLHEDRVNYIQRWPTRRYWLAKEPEITPLSDGVWDIRSYTGWEVSDGTNRKSGVARERLRVSQTPAGLKILLIQPE